MLLKDQLESENKLTTLYSYGEMFRIIHHASRLEIVSKEMIKAILACYSFILPRIFDEYISDYLEELGEQSLYDFKYQDSLGKQRTHCSILCANCLILKTIRTTLG